LKIASIASIRKFFSKLLKTGNRVSPQGKTKFRGFPCKKLFTGKKRNITIKADKLNKPSNHFKEDALPMLQNVNKKFRLRSPIGFIPFSGNLKFFSKNLTTIPQ